MDKRLPRRRVCSHTTRARERRALRPNRVGETGLDHDHRPSIPSRWGSRPSSLGYRGRHDWCNSGAPRRTCGAHVPHIDHAATRTDGNGRGPADLRRNWPDQAVRMILDGGGTGLRLLRVHGDQAVREGAFEWTWPHVDAQRTALVTVKGVQVGDYGITFADDNSYNQPSAGVLIDVVDRTSSSSDLGSRLRLFFPGVAAILAAGAIAIGQRKIARRARTGVS